MKKSSHKMKKVPLLLQVLAYYACTHENTFYVIQLTKLKINCVEKRKMNEWMNKCIKSFYNGLPKVKSYVCINEGGSSFNDSW